MNALARQARELATTTVVEELGNRRFLPRYGFPIGLNSLVVLGGRDGGERFQLQRDGSVAVAEYVPGAVIVVGGQARAFPRRATGLGRQPGRPGWHHALAVCLRLWPFTVPDGAQAAG